MTEPGRVSSEPSFVKALAMASDRTAMGLLDALRGAGYYVACADCNSSVSGIHYVGCSKTAPTSTPTTQIGETDD